MNNDDKIIKILESMDKRLDGIEKTTATKSDIEPIKKDLRGQGQVIAQVKTVVEALAEGQKDIRETMATKADVQDLDAKLVKKVQSHERRINTLEDEQGIPHPNKN